MYSLAGYGTMIADRVRMEAYTQALRSAVRPGSVVVDIGTGPGTMAVLACRLGASRVYAIETDQIIQVAREVAAANGCADKISFYEDLSTEVTLPTGADVIVSDLRGLLPFFQGHIPVIVDARRRFLAPGGTLIPRRDTVWVAIVEAPKPYGEIVDPWDHNSFGQDLSPARRRAVNCLRKVHSQAEQLLTKPQLWATLDYATIEQPDAQGKLSWVIEHAGTGHGVLAWFDSDLADGVALSNAPGTPETIYGSQFFPWTQPVALLPGQGICVNLEAKLTEGDYVWRWTTHIEPPAGSSASPLHWEQSQLQGEVLSAAKLRRRASDFVPRLSEEGRIHSRTLELMDGQLSLEQIARQLETEFPKRFTRWQQALSYAGAVSREYGL